MPNLSLLSTTTSSPPRVFQAFRLLALALLLLCSVTLTSQAQDKAAEYQILQVKDNIYRFTAGNYHSVFMVTDNGIFVTDPINPEAARYLKQELQARFQQPIRYMAYSHNHVDHAAGGHLLAEPNTTIIAQRYADEDMRWTNLPTALPDVTFKDEMTITLGESSVHLKHYGPNNGRGSVSMRFMPANVLYVVDWIVLNRMPYKDLQGYDIHGMIRSTREVLNEPAFDIFVGGHAAMGKRQDVERYLAYLEALYKAVKTGMLAGKSLPELQAQIQLPAFADLPMYKEWLPLNIAGVHRTLLDRSYFNLRKDIPGQR